MGGWIGTGIAVAVAWGLAATSAGQAPASDGPPVEVRRARYLMGSRCEVTAWGVHEAAVAEAIEAALDEVARLDALLSDYREDSELSRLNRIGGQGRTTISSDLNAFLGEAISWAAITDGAFDPTVGTLTAAWDLRGVGRIPSGAEIGRALDASGYRKVHLGDGPSAWFDVPGLVLDPGGIGKGYALDRAAAVLEARGVTAVLLELGGQFLALDPPPGEPEWRVAVADPRDRSRPTLLIRLRRQSVSTSGQAERGVQVGSRRLGHVLDPRRGVPVDWSGQVTVLAPRATAADALSTTALVLGREGMPALDPLLSGIGLAFMDAGGEGGRVRVFANALLRAQVVARTEGSDLIPLEAPARQGEEAAGRSPASAP